MIEIIGVILAVMVCGYVTVMVLLGCSFVLTTLFPDREDKQ